MDHEKSKKKDDLTFIRNLCPHLNEEQLKEAEENFKEYLKVVLRIYKRIQMEQNGNTPAKSLTSLDQKPIINQKRSNPS